jgi:hypothetical protein
MRLWLMARWCEARAAVLERRAARLRARAAEIFAALGVRR